MPQAVTIRSLPRPFELAPDTTKYFVFKVVEFVWLGREDSNLRIAESKSAALPLGYAPIGASAKLIRAKLIAKAGAGKEAPGGTPPRRLGRGEPCARRIGRAAIVKQRKTGSATAAHARQPSAR